MDLNKNVLWKVSLSNGETFYEEKGNFITIPGELSPWQRLLRYIANNGLLITSLSLYTRDGRTFNLPSAGKDPKFADFANLEKPIDFIFERKIARDLDIVDNEVKKVSISDHFTTIVAVYPEYKLKLWVDENNTGNCWVMVIKN